MFQPLFHLNMLIKPIGSQYISMEFLINFLQYVLTYTTIITINLPEKNYLLCPKGSRKVPLARNKCQYSGYFLFRIINVGFKFLVIRKRLTYHIAITDGIACRPLNYGVWNACET